ncbi:unnamed protein product [Periconia digitata]|uniref:Carrier domain-containing protein n=1 Tax=Periconia digitata TaxID=1303443 RepID=A0A9W4URP7_9PLEO|nr:unnamed protein product [Periconia digitata]
MDEEAILAEIANVCNIPLAAIEDFYPCTPLQYGIMAQPIERIYINCVYATLAPSIDTEKFCDALCHIYSLNPILRTRIVDSEFGLVQVVVKEALSITRPSKPLKEALSDEKSSSMRLGTPLFRVALLPADRKIILTTHHAISDGGTYHIMFDNIARAYNGLSLKPHADFKLFVKQCLSIDPEMATTFWGKRFSGHPTVFPKIDVGYTPDASSKIESKISLEALGVSVSLGLMPCYIETAWAITAQSYTGSESIVFGRVLSARSQGLGGLESTLGPTIVTMPVQANMKKESTIASLIKERAQERREALRSPALQYGLIRIREISDAAKVATGFTTLLNFRTPTDMGTEYTTSELELHEEYEPHLPYGLGINIVLGNNGLSIETLFDENVVAKGQVRRILRQLEHVMCLLLQSPAGTRLDKLPSLNQYDRHEIIRWNMLATEVPQKGLPGLFREMAHSQPRAQAIEALDGNMDYEQLNLATDLVANDLRRMGITVEDTVALIFEKSLWAVVAQLAVLKAGAVCVPIDPDFPASRMKTIISSSGAKMILTSAHHESSLAELGVTTKSINEQSVSRLPTDNTTQPQVEDDPYRAAFILFTSGSTGTPKGHTLEHRNLISSITAVGQEMNWGPDTRMLQFAAYVWDMSLAETFGTLIFGGCICVPSDEAREAFIAEFIRQAKANSAIFTPTVLRMITPQEASTLKSIISIGEPVDPESVEMWSGHARFINAWGPSETACISSMAELTPASTYRENIGKPIASAIWLIDDKNKDQLVPIGGIGEIVVESLGVARGYLNDKIQTASSFIAPPPWAPYRKGDISKVSRRMFRTGDLAKYNPDGSLQYIGRIDNQVKINGQRVELGEVEKVLGSCAAVQQAITAIQPAKEGNGRKDLIAILTLEGIALPTKTSLKEVSQDFQSVTERALQEIEQEMAARLPSYMVPTTWKIMEEFPRTTSLKIDRSSVKKWLSQQQPNRDNEIDKESLSPPDSPKEKSLQIIWAMILGRSESEIGRESSFIKLGGDSILAIKVATQCRKRGLRVSVATLLRSESLSNVAAASELLPNQPQTPTNTSRPKISTDPQSQMPLIDMNTDDLRECQKHLKSIGVDTADVEIIIPTTPLQEGILFSQLKNPQDYFMKLSMKLTPTNNAEEMDEKRIISAWEAVCSAQPILRTILTGYETTTCAYQQVIMKTVSPSISFGVVQPSEADNIEQFLDGLETPRFPLARPQHHLYLYRCSPTVVYATLHINHALFDERSMQLVGEQLGRAYTDTTNLHIYRNLTKYVTWIAENKHTSNRYWEIYLSGVSPCHIPTLDSEESKLLRRGSGLCDIPIKDSNHLISFCRDRGVTVANLMQAAWGIVLQRCTGNNSLCFGYLSSNLESLEGSEDTMGPSLSMLFHRFDVVPGQTLADVLRKANDGTSRGLEHGAGSMSEIQEALGVDQSPLFNTIMTIYRLWPDNLAGAGDLVIDHLPLQGHTEYAITLGVSYDNEKVVSKLLYDTSKISASFATHIVDMLARIVTEIIRDVSQPLETLQTEIQRPSLALCQNDIAKMVHRKAASQCEISSSMIENIYPCLPIQREQMETTVQGGLDQYVFKVSPQLSVTQLNEVWTHIAAVCPVLRSRIVSLDPYGVCVVTLKATPDWNEEDSLSAYLEWDRDLPSRYGRPLCRFGRVAESNGTTYFVLSLHQAVHDPWTISLLLKAFRSRVSTQYSQPLPSLHDFWRVIQNRTTGVETDTSSTSSTRQLNPPQYPPFRVDAPQTHLAGIESFDLKDSITAEVLRAAWPLTLWRVTGDSKVNFGLHVDGRNSSTNITSVAGPVGAIISLEMDLKNLTCQSLLHGVHNFVKICVNHDNLVAHDSRNVLVVDTSPIDLELSETPELQLIESIPSGSSFGDARLVIHCRVMSDKTSIVVRFDERLISGETVAILMEQYKHAAEQLSSHDPSTALTDLSILSRYEVSLLQAWNSDTPIAEDTFVHDQIRSVAQAHPTAPAVCSEDLGLTHQELDDLADRAASFLQREGVDVGTIVPYFFEKSAIAIVIMLGILKTGGTLLPLDIKHPSQRIHDILLDTGASKIFTSSTLLDAVKNKHCSQIIVSVDIQLIERFPKSYPPPIDLKTSNDVYIIYTSGSTGKPKGVIITHSNFSTSIKHRRDLVGMGPNTRTLQYLNMIFDVPMFDIFLTLVSGGCVCLPSDDEWHNDIAAAFRRTRANFAFLTPSLTTLMDPDEVPTLRTLGLTGEPFEKQIIEKWRNVRILNMYGPAEASVHSSGADVSFDSGKHHLNIGRAGGCLYWVVDVNDHNKLVSIGCLGELLIQGPIVSPGYLGNPRSTAFIDPPSWTQFGDFEFASASKWYKTGDVVVQLPDGSVIYHGRKDTQVKVSGQRIELEEIEYHVGRALTSKWEFAVELIKPPSGDPLLAVFFSNDSSSRFGNAKGDCKLLPPLVGETVKLNTSLGSALPVYMIPRIFVRLSKLPSTSSGKTDRSTLRRIGSELSPRQLSSYNPQNNVSESTDSSELLSGLELDQRNKVLTEMESDLQKLWAATLNIPLDTIKRTDNFFSMGGSSIRAMRLSHEARRTGIQLKVTDVFQASVLSEMAAVASRQTATIDHEPGASLTLTKELLKSNTFMSSYLGHATTRKETYLVQQNIESISEATDIQADMAACGELDLNSWHNDMVIDSPDGLDLSKLTEACVSVIKHHRMFRTIFVQHGSTLYQIAVRHVPTQDMMIFDGEETGNSRTPDMETYLPRFHFNKLSNDGKKCHQVRLQIHHALYDAISLDMVLQDLCIAYTSQSLKARPSFHDWIIHAKSAVSTSQSQEFWRSTLSKSTMTSLASPSVPTTPHACDATSSFQIPLQTITNVYGTPSSVVQAAWSLVLSRATNNHDIVFGAPNANRNLTSFADMDRVCGLVLNFLPARARLYDNMTFGELIKQMQDQAIATIQHQHQGFRSIIQECTDWPAYTRFNSVLIYQNHEALKKNIVFEDQECVLTPYGSYGRSGDLLVEVTPLPSTQNSVGEDIVVRIVHSTKTFTKDQIGWITQTFQEILEDIPRMLEHSVSVVGRGSGSEPYPVPRDTPADQDNAPVRAGIPSTTYQEDNRSMFDCRADLVTTMLLSRYYQQNGYLISIQDLIDHPTQTAQAALLDNKKPSA